MAGPGRPGGWEEYSHVDDVPDGRDDEVTRTDLPATRPQTTGPATDRVRIVGAEPAGEATSELPVVSRLDEQDERDEPEGFDQGPAPTASVFDAPAGEDDGMGGPTVRLTDQPGDPEHAVVNPVAPGQTAVPTSVPTPTELPHWTEPPTGQVPAVLSRDTGEDSGGVVGPSWREEDADWVAHDEEFEPAMLGGDEDQVALGSLDETDRTDIERRPWEFDLDPGPRREPPTGGIGSREPITEEVEVVSPILGVTVSGVLGLEGDEPDLAGSISGVSGVDAPPGEGPPGEDELFGGEKPRPTGSARVGRARRAGLRPARMRAKRPDETDIPTDAPLAAEPPGASVTEVPGAGRRRGGLASLAAADRSAEREGEQHAVEAEADSHAPIEVAAGVSVATGLRRRLSRHGEPDPASPTGQAPSATATGGGPPAPRLSRRVRPASGSVTAPAEAGGSIGLRVGTGIAVAVVALLAFKLGTVPALVLCVIVVTFAAGECFGVLRGAGYHPATLLGLVGTISLMVGAYSKGIAALPLVLVLITAFTLLWYLLGIERGSPVAGTAATLLTVGWVSLLGAYAGLLLSPSAFPDRHGIAFLLGAIIATVANDVGALVIGGWLGSHPLAPKISPNKTWEGLLGGAVFSILISTVLVGAIHPWSASNAALLGVVVAVVAPIGDLCESMLKRDLRLKDMGTLLPGHGGVLDRIDALLFVLPATYYLVRALNIA
jgi:CDP-diglyceride synthetase